MGTMVLQSVEYLMSKDCKRGQKLRSRAALLKELTLGKKLMKRDGKSGDVIQAYTAESGVFLAFSLVTSWLLAALPSP